ncbi:MAG: 2-oxoacid:acceptor oxidoreductase subunit alpha [Planctomycetes bacterium]|nr:2-oxoacid:acceptor oxidoreductase subunit alpha [Planctomycetota bacterium]MCK5579385.1 2-oxoacid:acceptor oxidoreductase subunit alpha [Planctomycetota bacterium]
MLEVEKPVLTGSHFMNGDNACAEGALAAGCRFFAGYPITPATEVTERMSERLPLVGGVYIQMEDEIASMIAILGASWAGKRSMTATSGPGFSLMMENMGLGIMIETPCVLVNVQRGGPSTGLPTLVGQGDMMQARWGSHGPYEIIALCPSSPQEMFDLTIKAFNLSEEFRTPVLVMADEVVGHMSEKVVIPSPEKIKIHPRLKTKEKPEKYLPFKPNKNLVPPMANAGEGYHIHITGLTHDEKGYPVINAKTQQKLVKRLLDKIRLNRDKIIILEEDNVEGADVVVVSYGISARTAVLPIQQARKEGTKVGLLRLVTVWPFPEERIKALAKKVKAIVVPELNQGQISLVVERCAAGNAKVISVPHMGGETHDPKEILAAIKQAVKK